MKKILFIQNNGSTNGGVWSVNHSLALKFKELGYDVVISAIRDAFPKDKTKDVKTYVVNEDKTWNVLSKKECIKLLFRFKVSRCINELKENKLRKKDILKLKDYINDYDPDFIIASHYQVLDGIPKEYLAKTIHVHHNTFNLVLGNRDNLRTLFKYNNRVTYCWLSKASMNKAKRCGLNNCEFIYNPVKFETKKSADVVKNKKLITLTRLVPEKRISLMIDIVDEVLQNKKLKGWTLDIYGTGVLKDEIAAKVKKYRNIKLYDPADAEKSYLTGSINLNTSSYEGFPMTILEASECAIPTVTLNYGESVYEQVRDYHNGFVALNIDDFKEKLTALMMDEKTLKAFSKNAKKNNEIFHIDNVIKCWEELFESIKEGIEKDD